MKNKIKLFLFLTLTTWVFIGCTNFELKKSKALDKMTYKPSEVIEIIKKNSKLPKQYIGLGAVHLVNNKKTTIHEDGSSDIHYFYITQIINYEGKKRLSDIVINYDPTNETLVLGDMYTVTKDYKKIAIPKNQNIEQDDELAIYSPSYVQNKNRIINFSKVEPGTYIITDYTIKTKYTYPLGRNERFDTRTPSLKKVRTLDYPTSLKLNYEIIGNNIVEKKKVVDGRNIITFSSKNTKVLRGEENIPIKLLLDINKVVYSFYKNWADMGKEKIESMENIKISSKVKKLSDEIVGDTKNKSDKIAKIYSYVVNDFTLQKIYLDQSDFKPLNLDKIIYQKYGSIIDLNSLFIGLVRAQNIDDVYPVIILDLYAKSSPYQIKYPMSYSVISVGAYVEGRIVLVNNRYNYLSALDENINYISRKNNYLPQAYDQKMSYKENKDYVYRLKDSGADINVSLESKGKRDYFIRSYGGMLPAQRKNVLNQKLGTSSLTMVGEAEFSDFMDYKKPMKMSYSLKADNLVIDQDKYLYFTIPPVKINLGVSLDKRNHDYQIYDEISVKETFRIDMSQNKNILQTSKFLNELSIIKEFKMGDRVAKYEFISKQDKNTINITRTVYIPTGIVKKEEYRDFKNFALDIKNPIRNKVFIKK